MVTGRVRLSRLLIVPLTLALLALSVGLPMVAAKNGGNSANAKMCQQGGWMELQGSNNATFANQGECVSYAARGGTLTAPETATLGVNLYAATRDGKWWNVFGTGWTPNHLVTFVVTGTGIVNHLEPILTDGSGAFNSGDDPFTTHEYIVQACGNPDTTMHVEADDSVHHVEVDVYVPGFACP